MKKSHTSNHTPPIISIKEVRKLLGSYANELTNDEICRLVNDTEQMARIILRQRIVPKLTKV